MSASYLLSITLPLLLLLLLCFILLGSKRIIAKLCSTTLTKLMKPKIWGIERRLRRFPWWSSISSEGTSLEVGTSNKSLGTSRASQNMEHAKECRRNMHTVFQYLQQTVCHISKLKGGIRTSEVLTSGVHDGLELIQRKYQVPNFVHLEPRSYKTVACEVQSRGFIAKTDETYQNTVTNQARKLRVFLEPPTKPLDPAHPSEGFVAMQNDNNKEVTRQVINQLCHDKVIFQHSKNLNDPAKIRNVRDILIEFNKRGYLDDQGRWSAKIDCPDLKAPHVTCQAGGGSSTEDLTARFMNRLVDATFELASLDYCQKYLSGCAEERKPDIIMVPHNPSQLLVQDWCQAVSLVEMKQHSVDVEKQECTYNTQWQVFGLVPIEMVLFISNNLHGHGTVAQHMTLSQCHIAEALQSVGTWEVMKKWLKGMEDECGGIGSLKDIGAITQDLGTLNVWCSHRIQSVFFGPWPEAFSPYRISDNGSSEDLIELFPIFIHASNTLNVEHVALSVQHYQTWVAC
ncbi:hypothetical protein DFH29DRAFT_877734 [Suillus ampliporus]|nr:hypothetical protein DFH29DRAFT_877734 [Suillus ampliporus]